MAPIEEPEPPDERQLVGNSAERGDSIRVGVSFDGWDVWNKRMNKRYNWLSGTLECDGSCLTPEERAKWISVEAIVPCYIDAPRIRQPCRACRMREEQRKNYRISFPTNLRSRRFPR